MLIRLVAAIAIALPLKAIALDPTEPESLYRIARFLLVPDSNSDETARGLRYLKRAADGAYEPAVRNYARRLASGDGVPKDEIAARRYYQLAAAKGDPASQLALAWMHQDGLGGDKDEIAAFQLRSAVAATGDPSAQYALGYSFLAGVGTERNPSTAAFWFRLAAEQGHIAAQSGLATLYRVGRGLPQDREQAICWYQQAAKQGDRNASRALIEIGR